MPDSSMPWQQLLYPDDVFLFFALFGRLKGVDHLILLDQDHQGVLPHFLERAELVWGELVEDD
jgi:hypothetical protein